MGVNPLVDVDIFSAVFRTSMKLSFFTKKLSGQIAISVDHPPVLLLDPDGSARDVLLPAEADSKGLLFYVFNTAGGQPEIISVKDDSDTDVILALDQNEVGLVHCDGTTWRGFSGFSADITATVAELNILDGVTATAAELNYLDLTTLGTGAASKAVVLDANGDYIWPAGQLKFQTATNALIMGSGASGAHHALGSTAGSALEFRFTGTHTTGDMRSMYLRMNFEGVGGSGEAARIFAVLNNVQGAAAGTINGAHISLSVNGASGTISGAGNAIRATIGMDADFAGGGTMSGILLDTAINTAATLTSVNLAAIRLGNADTKKWPVAIAFDGTVGSGEAVETSANAMTTNATSHAIHVTIDGVSGYIPVFDTNNWS